MNKLTTERLEKFVNDIKTDGMCDITDSQVESALILLLAYEQAADRPVGEIFRCSGNKTLRWWNDVPEGTVLYAAPVLPKQSELVENLKKVMNNWLAMEPKLAFQPEFTDVMMLLDVDAALAQPVSEPYKLPSGWKLVPIEPTAAMFHAFNDCDYGRKSMRERYIQMIAAAPAHTLSEHSAAIKDVITERQRQVSEEGWTPAHDDQYADCELTQAAICYIDTSFAETNWPWAAEWWKPTNPRRDLVKAGALILAEI